MQDEDGEIVGIVHLHDLHRVPYDQWSRTRVAAVMTPTTAIPTVSPLDGADRALEELARSESEELGVEEGGHLVGILRRFAMNAGRPL